MNYLEEIFNHIMTSHKTRFYRKEKRDFLDFVIKELKESGHTSEIVTGGEWITSTRNLITKPKNIKYILMAHYDTPGNLPLALPAIFKFSGQSGWVTNVLLSISFILQFLIVLSALIFFEIKLLNLTFNELTQTIFLMINSILLIMFLFLPVFKKNKNNANDNTSGVVTLMHVANLIKSDDELKNSVMFVFTDKEESGLWGSRHVKFYLESNNIDLGNIEIINIDCVGNGDTPAVGYAKIKNELADKFAQHLNSSKNKKNTIIRNISASDHRSFKKYNAIHLSMMKKTKLSKNYYLPNVHTNKDKDINLKNIEWFGKQILDYMKLEQGQKLENR